jgi:hypothetical protein
MQRRKTILRAGGTSRWLEPSRILWCFEEDEEKEEGHIVVLAVILVYVEQPSWWPTFNHSTRVFDFDKKAWEFEKMFPIPQVCGFIVLI